MTARERHCKYGRRGKGGGGDRDADGSDDGAGRDGSWFAGMETGVPRWANDPVWLHNGSRRESGQGRVQAPPPKGNQAEGGEGRSGLRRME